MLLFLPIVACRSGFSAQLCIVGVSAIRCKCDITRFHYSDLAVVYPYTGHLLQLLDMRNEHEDHKGWRKATDNVFWESFWMMMIVVLDIAVKRTPSWMSFCA